MATVDQYINAATRDNTRKSYQSAIEHYEVQWGGFLPATADSIARYLADYADVLAISTLKLRLAAIAQWHLDQGFPDPTKSPIVKKVMKGIQALHPSRPQQAQPLAISQLECIDEWLEQQLEDTTSREKQLRILRDRAILLLGFWRGFRSDELSRLRIEHLELHPDEGMALYLPHTKTDHSGATFKAPALQRLCPVVACQSWLITSGLTQGPLFPSINRWGQISADSMHPTSFITLLRNLIKLAGIANSDQFSSHSLRRGFATWATANGWDLKTTMEYIGWKDVRSAMRYIDTNPFAVTSLALPS
ncbi:Tn3 family resolvase [Cellvibrio sp. KY-GH-1]|uniref:site-specific integrase n=1 Tax=Cellvibrio sp. KY-GH-1 TaxID=2303332 RepID=UPI001247E74B|nr:site-specific integrase [Cellvibrio sp. KY-GH-1]QEY15330.1 Tn3 family resolvase [Cellvibrio sp. KY-GH-1]